MYINTNIQELHELTKHFYNITHTLITIYDKDQNPICAYPDSMSAFCTEVRSIPELHRKCLQCDRIALEICKETCQTYNYQCHMGLIEVATPIIYNGMILGYLLFGQITDKKSKEALLPTIRQTAEEYHLNLDSLSANLNKICYRSDDYIQSISKLLEMCANYIWLNSIISFKKEGIAYSLDMYIKEHIEEDLNVHALCRQFNIGRTTLYEIAKKNFGCNITEHIQHYRNEYAKKLLKGKEMTVSEVAAAVGIPDTNYFIRFFKKHNGCTPAAYRKNPMKKALRTPPKDLP